MEQALAQPALAVPRVFGSMFGVFAVIALILSSVGLLCRRQGIP